MVSAADGLYAGRADATSPGWSLFAFACEECGPQPPPWDGSGPMGARWRAHDGDGGNGNENGDDKDGDGNFWGNGAIGMDGLDGGKRYMAGAAARRWGGRCVRLIKGPTGGKAHDSEDGDGSLIGLAANDGV